MQTKEACGRFRENTHRVGPCQQVVDDRQPYPIHHIRITLQRKPSWRCHVAVSKGKRLHFKPSRQSLETAYLTQDQARWLWAILGPSLLSKEESITATKVDVSVPALATSRELRNGEGRTHRTSLTGQFPDTIPGSGHHE